MPGNTPQRVAVVESVDHVIAGGADFVEQDPRLRAMIPKQSVVFSLELVLQEIDEQRYERDVSQTGQHNFADLRRPPSRDPNQGCELSFKGIPGEIDKSDTRKMLVIEPSPLSPRQWRVLEQGEPHGN